MGGEGSTAGPARVLGAAVCAGRQRAEVEELRRQLEASSSAVTRALKEEYAKEKEEQERRHQVWFSPRLLALNCCSWSSSQRMAVVTRAGTAEPHAPTGTVLRAAPGCGMLWLLELSGCLVPPQAEVKVLKEQLEMEKQAWEANYLKKEVMARAARLQKRRSKRDRGTICRLCPQEAWLLSRERELREELRKERDKEIELVIQRLEADMSSAKEECERAAENRYGEWDGAACEPQLLRAGP